LVVHDRTVTHCCMLTLSLSFINHFLSAWRENRSCLFTECRGCLATWWYSVINNNPLCLCFISHFSLVALFLFASQDDWLSDKHWKFGRMRDAGAILSCRLLCVEVTTFRLYTREVSAGGRWQAHSFHKSAFIVSMPKEKKADQVLVSQSCVCG